MDGGCFSENFPPEEQIRAAIGHVGWSEQGWMLIESGELMRPAPTMLVYSSM